MSKDSGELVAGMALCPWMRSPQGRAPSNGRGFDACVCQMLGQSLHEQWQLEQQQQLRLALVLLLLRVLNYCDAFCSELLWFQALLAHSIDQNKINPEAPETTT